MDTESRKLFEKLVDRLNDKATGGLSDKDVVSLRQQYEEGPRELWRDNVEWLLGLTPRELDRQLRIARWVHTEETPAPDDTVGSRVIQFRPRWMDLARLAYLERYIGLVDDLYTLRDIGNRSDLLRALIENAFLDLVALMESDAVQKKVAGEEVSEADEQEFNELLDAIGREPARRRARTHMDAGETIGLLEVARLFEEKYSEDK